ncbi:hypothetical protein Daesc_008442 [Daldinia eschscholtzii]|uniref:Uncharacterized protein n=1 Tax=Daldinia eschscholtzii TaxID=292717 RepID=A0AAX6MCG6_9PEZI
MGFVDIQDVGISALELAANDVAHNTASFVVNTDASTEKGASGSPSTSMATNSTEKHREGVDVEKIPEPRPVSLMAKPQVQQNESNHLGRKVQNSKTADNVPCLDHGGSSTESSRSEAGQGKDRWPLAGRSPLSDDEIDLLKYYGHHVAPWVSLYFRHTPA